MTDVFDLDAVAPQDTVTLAAPLPSGVPSTWMWTFAGPGHPATERAREASYGDMTARQRARQQKVQDALDAGREPPVFTDTLKDIRASEVALLAPRVLDFTPVMMSGTVTEYSPDAVTAILMNPKLDWVYQWVRGRLGSLDAFFPAPPAPSSDTPDGNSPSGGDPALENPASGNA